jgi:phage shock protein C
MGMELRNRLYRSRSERMIAGVAGGVANYLDVDPTLIRLAWALAALATGPVALLLYIVCALIMPSDPQSSTSL